MRTFAALALLAVAEAGCGGHTPETARVLGAQVQRCADGEIRHLGSQRTAYVGVAPYGAIAYDRPGGAVRARFGPKNVNSYPTVFGVTGAVVRRDCSPSWYRVQLPRRPNGITGYVRARALDVQTVKVRILVDVSDRRLTLFRAGRPELTATVAVGSPSTPTPTGRYYVNQRLVPTDPRGPFGPGAIGISAFSNVLTGWTQGGPIAIHGTNEPWSIGHAVSNGCIRLPNPTLEQVFRQAVAGTPVIIRA
ncbi:MAG: L,D-transpeptidase [Thermoleophilia bacterium]|nr:L,D-transpeptidase [Thermoleophilia bacterium]